MAATGTGTRAALYFRRYTAIDLAMLGVVAAVSGVVFALTWNVYEFGKAIGGPVIARIVSYGLWFIGAPLGAALVRKPGAAFLGETLGAFVETIIPTLGGWTNLVYGALQGLASEAAYALFHYRKWGTPQAALAGAFAGPVAVALDAVLFAEIAPPPVITIWAIAATISGAIYGAAAHLAATTIKR